MPTPPPAATAHIQEHDIVNRRIAFLRACEAPQGPPSIDVDNLPPINWLVLLGVLAVLCSATAGLGYAMARKYEPCECYVQTRDGKLQRVLPPNHRSK